MRLPWFKCRVEVENWSGRSALSIFQDFQAKVLALNLTAVLASTAQEIVDDRRRDDSHPKQVNMTQAGQHDPRAVRDEGRAVRDEGRAVRDEGRAVRDEGRAVRDE